MDSRTSVYILGGSVCGVLMLVLGKIVFGDVERLCSDVKHGHCRRYKMPTKKNTAIIKRVIKFQMKNAHCLSVENFDWVKMESFKNQGIIPSVSINFDH
jgi:hypothetical protein